MTFERIVEFQPAYDKRDPDPKKNYGIHGVTLRMVLKGDKGAVQFVLFTGWQLPHITKEQTERLISKAKYGYMLKSSAIHKTVADEIRADLKLFWSPMPADLGYHSKFPMYEGHEPMGSKDIEIIDTPPDDLFYGKLEKTVRSIPTGTFTPCEFTDNGPCYYDGSGLNAERIYKILLEKGSDGVWEELEKYYKETFNEK